MAAPLQRFLERTHARLVADESGAVADYIPELAKADPGHFGIALVTVDGQCYTVGDCEAPFTIQSISKPLTFGLALDELGLEAVARRVGVEPSGDAFNSISLEPVSGRPLNPMINAGAIATAGCVASLDPRHALQRLLGAYGRAAARTLEIDDAVYCSERDTGHRNRAIAHLLRNFEMIDDPEAALDLYFRQCSVTVTGVDLAMIGATLANKGVNPRTGLHALREATVERVLSVMSSCGMYDFSGSWMYEVGMPAKSGVGGGILAVSPGQFGLGVFSPRLDARGNSVRGIATCNAVSREFGLHVFDSARATRAVLRSHYDAATRHSSHERSAADAACIDALGACVQVFELQGDLLFGGMEYLSRRFQALSDDVRTVVLDCKRVLSISRGAERVLETVVEDFSARDVTVILTRSEHLEEVAELVARTPGLRVEPTTDLALRACEEALLDPAPAALVDDLARFDLCAGLDEPEREALAAVLEDMELEPGVELFQHGEAAVAVYLLRNGSVSVYAGTHDGGLVRVGSVSAGAALGEMALLASGTRTATAIPDQPTRVWRLAQSNLERLSVDLRAKLLAGLARTLAGRLERANRQIAALA